ncbi:MAG: protoporphyrinogen oxidase, partial [Rhodospirillaceae bacterium]|nr:protoporphyrinogen oxidase [Rhodospirillaceae bacterium]
MSVDAVIIGGGVSGLATAYHLKKQGLTVRVLERQVKTGGSAVSERIGGFLMEHGPSSLNVMASEATNMSTALGLDGEVRNLSEDVKNRYLIKNGKLKPISIHPMGFMLSNYLSLPARARIAMEMLIPHRAGGPEETVAEYSNRRFGREFTDRVIEPLVGGIYSGIASELSMASVFPALTKMEREYGSLIIAVLSRWLKGGKAPQRRLFSWKNGVGTLPSALAIELNQEIHTGAVVRAIRKTAGGFRVEMGFDGSINAKTIIIATQPHVAAGLLEPLDVLGASAASAISAPPLSVVFLGYSRDQVDHPLDGLGYLTPPMEGRNLSGTLFASSMFGDRAPEGCVALSAYIGGAREPGLAAFPEKDLVQMARDEFGELLGVRGDPVVARVRQWPRGLPQLSP